MGNKMAIGFKATAQKAHKYFSQKDVAYLKR